MDLSHLCGWVDHEDIPAVAAAAPKLSEVAPHFYRAVDPSAPIYLYKAWKDVLGKYPDYPAQAIGDCTSFGTGHTIDLLECIRIATEGKAEAYKETCTEAIYGAGREIAGMLGHRGDGCFGGAVAKAVVQVGFTSREAVGTYSGQRAKQWGTEGVPADVKATLSAHKVADYALLNTPDDADAALAGLKPFLICSDVGFNTPRDSDGVCRRRGSWAHCMSVSARRVKGGRRQYCVDQSWGSDQPTGPLSDDQPPFSFWIDEKDLASILAGQDSYALTDLNGWPGKPAPSHWTNAGLAS